MLNRLVSVNMKSVGPKNFVPGALVEQPKVLNNRSKTDFNKSWHFGEFLEDGKSW